MRLFRRSLTEDQLAEAEAGAGPQFPEIVSAKDPMFASQHDQLDALEERLQNLQTPMLPPIDDRIIELRTINDRITPSAGRVNEVDLRHVIELGSDDDEDADFERRFNAFANHSDVGAPNWID